MQILLIGGGSGAGKTSLGRELSTELGMPLGQADDFRLFAQRITAAEQLPELHFFVDHREAAARGVAAEEELRDRLIAVADLVCLGLEIVVAHHLAADDPLILEGDAITPALAAQAMFNGVPADDRVRAVFVHEPSESVLLDNMLLRGRGIEQLAASEQTKGARLAWLYGNWIAGQAAQRGLPVVLSRPLETLFERVMDVLEVDR